MTHRFLRGSGVQTGSADSGRRNGTRGSVFSNQAAPPRCWHAGRLPLQLFETTGRALTGRRWGSLNRPVAELRGYSVAPCLPAGPARPGHRPGSRRSVPGRLPRVMAMMFSGRPSRMRSDAHEWARCLRWRPCLRSSSWSGGGADSSTTHSGRADTELCILVQRQRRPSGPCWKRPAWRNSLPGVVRRSAPAARPASARARRVEGRARGSW
jgi:hypothetical protein